MLRKLSLLATLVLAGVLAWIACRTPDALSASAPGGRLFRRARHGRRPGHRRRAASDRLR